MTVGGLPHSEISGSKRACRSPKLIAAYRVLRRLMMPRHPSCARIRLAEDRNLRHLVYVAILFPRLCSCQRAIPPKRGNPFCAENAAGLVGVPGVEPGTSSLSGTRSNQLSYTPAPPQPPARPLSRWWRQPGSNRRHPACKAGALPTELCPRGTSISTLAQALFGPLNAVRKGCGRHILAPAGLMCGAFPPPPPRRAFHHRPASPPGCSLERR